MAPPNKKQAGGLQARAKPAGPKKLPGRGMPRSAGKKRPIDEQAASQMRAKKIFHRLKLIRKSLKDARQLEQRKLHKRIKQATDEAQKETDADKKANLEKQAAKFRVQLECSKTMDLDTLSLRTAQAKGIPVPEGFKFSSAPGPKKGGQAGNGAQAAEEAVKKESPEQQHAREVLETRLMSSGVVTKAIEEIRQTLDKLERVLSSQLAGSSRKEEGKEAGEKKGKKEKEKEKEKEKASKKEVVEEEKGESEDEEEAPEAVPVGRKRKAASEEPEDESEEEEEDDEEVENEEEEEEGDAGAMDIDAILAKLAAARGAREEEGESDEDLVLVDEEGHSFEAPESDAAGGEEGEDEEGEGAEGGLKPAEEAGGASKEAKLDKPAAVEKKEKKNREKKEKAPKDRKEGLSSGSDGEGKGPKKGKGKDKDKEKKPQKPKNRPGQLKRRKMAEKMFGADANHIKKGMAPVDKKVGEKILGIKKERSHSPAVAAAAAGTAPGLREKGAGGAAAADAGGLHASWEAKKKEKELMAAALKGGVGGAKKITFDDDE